MSPVRIQLAWKGLELTKALATYYANLAVEDFTKLDTGPCTQMLYSLIMLNKYVALDSPDGSVSSPSSSPWNTQIAFKEAEVERLGSEIIQKMASLVTVEKLYDDSRPIWWALGWIIKNMVYGHQQKLCFGMSNMSQASRTEPLVDTTTVTPASEPTPNALPAEHESMRAQVVEPKSPPFAMSFPDVTFDNPMVWQDGMFQPALWDTM